MRKFQIRSIIIGIGIGIVLTSIMGLINSASNQDKLQMSQADIIKEAERLGMVKGSLFETPESKATPINTPIITITPSVQKTIIPTQ